MQLQLLAVLKCLWQTKNIGIITMQILSMQGEEKLKKNNSLQHQKEFDTKTLLPGLSGIQSVSDPDEPISPASIPNRNLHPATASQIEKIDQSVGASVSDQAEQDAQTSGASDACETAQKSAQTKQTSGTDQAAQQENQTEAADSKEAAAAARKTRAADDLKELSEFQKQPLDDRMTQVYNPRPLTPEDEVYDDVMEHFASTPTKPKYWFEEMGDYWSCSCGHINKGDRCGNCGLERDLLRSLFILHKPDENAPASKPITYTTFQPPETVSAKKHPSRKLKIGIIAVVAALIIAGIAVYFTLVIPAVEQQEAQKKQNDENFQTTLEQLEALNAHKEGGSLVRSSYIALGDQYYKNGKYQKAMETYANAQELKKGDDVTDKINQAKFGYVKANQSKKSNQVEAYMDELLKIDYPGIQEIYDAYYAWHVKLITNLKENDYSNDVETASRNDTVYFHIMLSGGKPSEEIELYYEITWPNGSSQISNLDQKWKDGSKVTARFQYPIPLFGREGKLTFNLYNKSTKEKIGSDSILLQK